MNTIIAKKFNGNVVSLHDHAQSIAGLMRKHIPASLIKTHPNIVAIVDIVAKLHDIGKATPLFQDLINNHSDDEGKIDDKLVLNNGDGFSILLHNEVGGMYLQLLNLNKMAVQLSDFYHEEITVQDLGAIIEAVQFSHGVSDFSSKKHSMAELKGLTYTSNGKTHNAIDITMLDSAYADEFGAIPPHKDARMELASDEPIKYFDTPYGPYNSYKQLQWYQSLPIFLISLLKGVEISEGTMDKKFPKIDLDTLKKPDAYDDRFYEQIENAKRLLEVDGTTAIEACTGYGKTLIALLYAIAQDKMTYIVTPQNNLVDDVARSIQSFLVDLKLDTVIGWEAVHGGKIVSAGGNSEDVRLKIINIDAFVNPYSSSYSAADAYNMLSCTCIFDEVQLYANGHPMYAGYDVILKTRDIIGAKTVLSSATDDGLFDDELNGFHTEVVNDKSANKGPNDSGVPFMFAGDTEYTFIEVDDTEIEPENIPNSPDTAYIAATVERSQRAHLDIFYNSYQDASTRAAAQEEILATAGKHGTHDKSISSCQLLNTGINISVDHGMYIDVVSMSGLIQSLGRTSRFAPGKTTVYLMMHSDAYLANNKGYAKVIDSKTGKELYNRCLDFLKLNFVGKTMTKVYLYKLYRDFCTENSDLLRRFRISQQNKGLDVIRNGIDVDVSFDSTKHKQCSPKRVSKKQTDKKVHSPTNWRSPGFGYFITAHDSANALCSPISYSNAGRIKNWITSMVDGNASPYTFLKAIAVQASLKYPELSEQLSSYLKKHTNVSATDAKNLLFRMARCEDTPLIVPNALYDTKRGLIL